MRLYLLTCVLAFTASYWSLSDGEPIRAEPVPACPVQGSAVQRTPDHLLDSCFLQIRPVFLPDTLEDCAEPESVDAAPLAEEASPATAQVAALFHNFLRTEMERHLGGSFR